MPINTKLRQIESRMVSLPPIQKNKEDIHHTRILLNKHLKQRHDKEQQNDVVKKINDDLINSIRKNHRKMDLVSHMELLTQNESGKLRVTPIVLEPFKNDRKIINPTYL